MESTNNAEVLAEQMAKECSSRLCCSKYKKFL